MNAECDIKKEQIRGRVVISVIDLALSRVISVTFSTHLFFYSIKHQILDFWFLRNRFSKSLLVSLFVVLKPPF